MRSGVLRAVAAVTTLVTIGCAVESERPATLTAPTDALQSRPVPAGTCDLGGTLKAAKDYLSSNDPIVGIYGQLGDAINAGDAALIKAYGFNALARLAYGRTHALGHLAADGAKAALGTVNCIPFATSEIPAELTLANLTSAFGITALGGIVEVRGGEAGDPGVTTADPTGPVISPLASPLWGAETTDGTWKETFGQRSFVVGYILSAAPANFETLSPGATAFELMAVPKQAALVHQLLVSDCVTPTDFSRLQHSNGIVKLETNASLCFANAGSVVASASGTGIFASAQRVLNWLAPRPLYASMMLTTPATSGKIGSLSPNASTEIDPLSISLSISHFSNVVVNTNINVTVTDATAKANKVEDVLVALAVAGNNGIGSDGNPVLQPNCTDPEAVQQNLVLGPCGRTDANGQVTIIALMNKTGSYTIRADGFFDGLSSAPTQSIVGNKFKVTGQ
jgi:hypothetical protein